jgi:N-glycosylase/DNA lyase
MSIPTGFRFLSLPISQLNLSAVLKCGQSFRWQATELPIPHSDPPSLAPSHEWRLALADRVVLLRQTPSAIYYSAVFPEALVAARTLDEIEDTTLAWLRDYFQLSVDLAKLYDFWSEKDEIFKGKAARFSGIRILRQDPWENLIS